MAKDKHSFILYSDIHFTLKKLTDEQSGKLFKHILAYVNDENPVMDDLLLEVAFEPIKQALKRDLKRYEAICERNKLNGEKGGRPKKKPKKPSGLIGNPKNPDEPKKADNDNDIDNGIDKEQKKKIIYSEFYDSEIAKSNNDPEYIKVVEALFGKNNLGTPLKCVLKMESQLSYEQFSRIRSFKKKHTFSIINILESMENWGNPKKYKTVYGTFQTFLKNELKVKSLW